MMCDICTDTKTTICYPTLLTRLCLNFINCKTKTK